MRKHRPLLPLYNSVESLALETDEPRSLDKGCTRCDLHETARSVCIGGDGEPGGLLLVGESPGRTEDAVGRPFIGETGKYLRQLVRAHWKGPVVFDNALRCVPGKNGIKQSETDACRGYLTQTLHEAAPTRIIAMGAWAARSVLGRAIAPMTTRRAYAHTSTGVPVFLLMHPTAGLRNRFVRRWFEDDFEWALSAEAPRAPLAAMVRLVQTPQDAELAIAHLRRAPRVAFDVEGAGLLYDRSFRLFAVGFCAEGSREPFVWTREACADPAARAPMLSYLADPKHEKGGQNVKFDMAAIAFAWGVMPRGITFDTRLQRKILEPEADASLAKMAEMVGMGGHKGEADDAMEAAVEAVRRRLMFEKREEKRQLSGKPVPKGKRAPDPPTLAELGLDESLERVVRSGDYDDGAWKYSLLPDETLYRYNGRDAVSTMALAEDQSRQLAAEPALARTWQRIVRPASEAIARVESWGVQVDADALRLLDLYLVQRIEELQGELSGFDATMNWGSPKQVADYFFKREGLKAPKLTDSGAQSTDEEVLEILAKQHPAANALVQFRKVGKLRGTYAQGMLPHIRNDGRIHPTILLDGARSGRTSCQNPNLQNIPSEKRDPEGGPYLGRMCRDVFVARRGYKLLSADYSQIELRVAAMLSRDPKMLEVFTSIDPKTGKPVDYHQRTAELISQLAWGIPPEKVEPRHRVMAKTINFGLLYGKGDKSLAEEFGCKVSEVAKMRAAILGEFKQLAKWCQEKLAESRRTGLAWTMWEGQPARRRPLWRIGDQDDYLRSVAEHGAVNTPIQGTANEYCIVSLWQCVEWLRRDAVPAMLVLPIHDALLFEVRDDAVEEVAYGVRQIMTSHDSGDVPIKVDIEVGDAWGSLEKYKMAALPCPYTEHPP